jgi:Protein of unknown function (DUF3179)
MERVNEILNLNAKEFQQVLMNVSCGDKLLGCAALSAAFINGIKAFGMDTTGTVPLIMPVLKLSYSEIISDAKVKILKAIDSSGGTIESLDQLEQLSGYGKPLLSYHVQGEKDSKGLADLELLIDKQTGSEWNFEGKAINGKMKGKQLARLPFDEGFWFEWVAFHPGTAVYPC